jgi:hypothetical protein
MFIFSYQKGTDSLFLIIIMKNSHLLISVIFFYLVTGLFGKKPNIVIVITDDQGYGDLGCTGNPVIKTPHTDKLANESVWLTDYHVAPTCSPNPCGP